MVLERVELLGGGEELLPSLNIEMRSSWRSSWTHDTISILDQLLRALQQPANQVRVVNVGHQGRVMVSSKCGPAPRTQHFLVQSWQTPYSQVQHLPLGVRAGYSLGEGQSGRALTLTLTLMARQSALNGALSNMLSNLQSSTAPTHSQH